MSSLLLTCNFVYGYTRLLTQNTFLMLPDVKIMKKQISKISRGLAYFEHNSKLFDFGLAYTTFTLGRGAKLVCIFLRPAPQTGLSQGHSNKSNNKA